MSHSKPAHAAKEFENLLTPSIYYPLQSLIHSHWENSSDIKHSYILDRHTQNNSLPCPEIALFCPAILQAFISEARFALRVIVFSEQVRCWFELLTHTFMKHSGLEELLEISQAELCVQLCHFQQNAVQVSLYMFTA